MSYLRLFSLACVISGVEKALWGAGLFAWASVGAVSSEHAEARAYLQDKKWAEAAIILRTLQKRYPEEDAVAVDLAQALLYSGRREEAVSVLGQGGNKGARAHRRAASGSGLVSRIRVLSRSFLTNETFQIFQDGMGFLKAGKVKPARDKFERALEREPDNMEILTRLGQCLVLEKDEDSAAERLRLARRLNPYEPETRLWLGRAMHQRGEAREAIDELKAAFPALPASELAPVWLAEALSTIGQTAQGIRILEEDLERNPMHLATLVTLAKLRIQSQGRDASALWSARKSLQLAESRFKPYYAETHSRDEGELGVAVRAKPEDLREEIAKLSDEIDGRLETLATGGPVPKGASDGALIPKKTTTESTP